MVMYLCVTNCVLSVLSIDMKGDNNEQSTTNLLPVFLCRKIKIGFTKAMRARYGMQ